MRRQMVFLRGARLVRHVAPFPTSPRVTARAQRSRLGRDPPRVRARHLCGLHHHRITRCSTRGHLPSAVV